MSGIILANITEGKSAPKFSAAIIVLGLGEIIFPLFPPPIITSSSCGVGIPNLRPIDNATGATVITATSIKTPTAHNNIVANAKAK